jgi:hypothetical protein
VPTFVATYLEDALRVVLAALAILVIGIVLWLLLDLLRDALGIETPTVGLLSTAVIALFAPMVGGYASTRFITPISLTHAVLAGAIVSVLYVFIFTTGLGLPVVVWWQRRALPPPSEQLMVALQARRLTIAGGDREVGSVAAGAGRQCAPAALIGRLRAAPQLHR